MRRLAKLCLGNLKQTSFTSEISYAVYVFDFGTYGYGFFYLGW